MSRLKCGPRGRLRQDLANLLALNGYNWRPKRGKNPNLWVIYKHGSPHGYKSGSLLDDRVTCAHLQRFIDGRYRYEP